MAHLTHFSFEFFYKIFTEDASLSLLYHSAKKSKWPKTQIKGGPALSSMKNRKVWWIWKIRVRRMTKKSRKKRNMIEDEQTDKQFSKNDLVNKRQRRLPFTMKSSLTLTMSPLCCYAHCIVCVCFNRWVCTVNYRYNVIDRTLKKLRCIRFYVIGITYFLQKHSKLGNIGLPL